MIPDGEPAATGASSDAILDRLLTLHPKRIDLSLARIERLLDRLGTPQRRLPAVIHVAGTNGKGSVVAFLRAIFAAHGLTSHVYTSPHLVRFHERIVVAGREIDEAALAALLDTCETANAGAPITFFEITTAAAFLAFAAVPSDVTLLETGLGGRLDATNVVAAPALTVITPVDLDHQDFLGDSLAAIAAEKAGILKRGVACVLAAQPTEAERVIRARAAALGAPLSAGGVDWRCVADAGGLGFSGLGHSLRLPPPGLPGPFQTGNAGQAVAAAMLWLGDRFDPVAAGRGLATAVWPARLQRLTTGPLSRRLPPGVELWLDGGHNPAAGRALAEALAAMVPAAATGLICGMMANKDAAGFLAPLAPWIARMVAVPIPGTAAGTPPEALAVLAGAVGISATTAPDVTAALEMLRTGSAPPARLLIAGSLYLAGEVLRCGQR